jgi:hypothetical protein
MEIHAPSRDERYTRSDRRNRPESDCVRGMRVDDIDATIPDQPSELEASARIGFEARRAGNDVDPGLVSPLRKRLTRSRRDDRGVAATGQFGGEPEHLTLPPAPTTLRVDVKNAHQEVITGCG